MKVTILTAASYSYWPLMELSAPNKLEYALKFGMQLNMCTHAGTAGIHDHWGEREQFMLDALSVYSVDWLWFMGADTIITNMTKDVRDYCDPAFDFIIGEDVNGINNDSFLLQNTRASHEFLKRVLFRRDQPTDQHAMGRELNAGGLRTSIVSQRLFNSYKYDEYGYGPQPGGTWVDGDLAMHFPGLVYSRRLELMREYLLKVRR